MRGYYICWVLKIRPSGLPLHKKIKKSKSSATSRVIMLTTSMCFLYEQRQTPDVKRRYGDDQCLFQASLVGILAPKRMFPQKDRESNVETLTKR